MNPILKNVLVFIGAWFLGSIVNSLLVSMGPMVIALPEGASVADMETLKESMKLFKPQNFIFPFLGHAVGTLVAAFVVAKFAATNHMKLALGIGALFLIGGITAVLMLGGPLWFKALDLIVAYIPMAWLGGTLAGRKLNA